MQKTLNLILLNKGMFMHKTNFGLQKTYLNIKSNLLEGNQLVIDMLMINQNGTIKHNCLIEIRMEDVVLFLASFMVVIWTIASSMKNCKIKLSHHRLFKPNNKGQSLSPKLGQHQFVLWRLILINLKWENWHCRLRLK